MKLIFEKIPIPHSYGPVINNIYFVFQKDGKSKAYDALEALDQDAQDQTRSILFRMATTENYKSPSIKYNLSKYNFGEIRPMPHRFFFFRKCGNNFIFFWYEKKDKPSLDNKIYKRINKAKETYENEFKNQIEKSR